MIYLNGEMQELKKEFIANGAKAPDFTITTREMKRLHLSDFKDKCIVFNIFPSIDTDVCATSVRRFNQMAAELKDCVVVCVSKDLPFALSRFCGAEGIKNVITASDFYPGDFGENYGVIISKGILSGLLARAIVVVKDKKIYYTQLVEDINSEPDYMEVIQVLSW